MKRIPGIAGTGLVLALLLSASSARADQPASCTLIVVHARNGESAASMDPALSSLSSLLSVPPFSIYSVFRKLAETTVTFDAIGEERPLSFSTPELAGVTGRLTYTGYQASSGDLLVELRVMKGNNILVDPVTLRLAGGPVLKVVPWPDAMNALILVLRCSATPAPAAAP